MYGINTYTMAIKTVPVSATLKILKNTGYRSSEKKCITLRIDARKKETCSTMQNVTPQANSIQI